MNADRQIVRGITVSNAGQATIDPSLHDVLFDLAIALEAPTALPVDIQHVVAAILLAARKNEIDSNQTLSAGDKHLMDTLAIHVRTVFSDYGGIVGSEE